MKTLLYTLIGVALITSIGITTHLLLSQHEDDLKDSSLSVYIPFIDDSLIDGVMTQLQGKTSNQQLSIIKTFMLQNRKFFNANAIMKILMVLNTYVYPDYDTVRNDAIMVLKPYIAPLSTNEAVQVIRMISAADGLASGVLANQVYDVYGNQTNLNALGGALSGYQNQNYNQIVLPQSTKQFWSNFLITTEGKHIGFVVDQSSNMNVQVNQANSQSVSRYQLLSNFYQGSKHDLFQSFFGLSFVFSLNTYSCLSCTTASYEQCKGFQDSFLNFVYWTSTADFDLYSKLSYLLSNPNDQLSDVYVLSTGIITGDKTNLIDFIQLINDTNSQRRIKIRINTVSVLVGGNEDQSTRDQATRIMQGLADYTGGTFFQLQAQY